MTPVVCNSSPLIGPEQIGYLNLHHDLFHIIVVPVAVVAEVEANVFLPIWIEQKPLSQNVGSLVMKASLGAGESEAIALALELDARLVILDDLAARRLAQSLDLNVIGTLGLLALAKKKGLIAEIKPCLDDLLRFNFRVAPSLYEQLLEDSGEGNGRKL